LPDRLNLRGALALDYAKSGDSADAFPSGARVISSVREPQPFLPRMLKRMKSVQLPRCYLVLLELIFCFEKRLHVPDELPAPPSVAAPGV
jgi:hypothetical protein